MTDVPVCIDISHHQGVCDMEEVAASGILGVIHKATEGTSFVDDMRAENLSNAKAAGLAIATYHWLSPGSDPNAQMEFYLSKIDPCRGERVVIDYEEDGCSLTQLKNAVQALIDASLNLQICIYSGHLLKEQLQDDCDEFLRSSSTLWLAQYTSGTPTWPDETYNQWSLWQYSETGEVRGIDDAYVDLNNFNGTDEEFLAWINPKGQAPVPPRPPKPPTRKLVAVDITAPEGVEVEVTVNGSVRRLHQRRRILRGPDIFR